MTSSVVFWRAAGAGKCLFLLLLLSTKMHYGVCSPIQSDEEQLLAQLFTQYNPTARPVMDSGDTVNVTMQFSLMHVKELNVISQVLTTTGLLIMTWVDERLRWYPSRHGNLTELFVEAKGLWKPEFAVINGAEKIYEDYNNFRAIITNDGVVRWEPGGVFKTMCQIDITYYPFDEQECDLIFGAWSYHTTKMNLTTDSDVINLDSYKKNGEWEIISTKARRNEFFYECCPNERFSNVAFTMRMRRRHTFYIMNVILPSILTSVLLLSIFFCTPGQKVQIGVVVLLSFRIFLLNVADNIPKTSDHILLLGIYLTSTMAITTLSMVLTVFVLNLHHVTEKPVPWWVQKLVLIYLAKSMGICRTAKEAEERRRERKPVFRRASMRYHGNADEATAIIELLPTSDHGTFAADGSPKSSAGPQTSTYTTASNSLNSTPAHKPLLPSTSKAIAMNDEDLSEEELKRQYAKDWRTLAEVFDRLFFWLFFFAILTSTLVLFHPLTDAYFKRIGLK